MQNNKSKKVTPDSGRFFKSAYLDKDVRLTFDGLAQQLQLLIRLNVKTQHSNLDKDNIQKTQRDAIVYIKSSIRLCQVVGLSNCDHLVS